MAAGLESRFISNRIIARWQESLSSVPGRSKPARKNMSWRKIPEHSLATDFPKMILEELPLGKAAVAPAQQPVNRVCGGRFRKSR